jgi:hypothetical protein
MGSKRESIGHRRRAWFLSVLLAVGIVVGLASVASAHDVTGTDVDCSAVKIHFANFPGHGVPVHIVVVVNYLTAVKDVTVDKNTSEATVDISAFTAPMFGNTSAVWIDVTWTNYGDQHVHEVQSVTCGVRPTTTTKSSTSTSSSTSSTSTTSTTIQGNPTGKIFQVEFRACHLLHVGYQRIPGGTIVSWRIRQGGREIAVGSFVAVAGKGYHFMSQDIGTRFDPDVHKAGVTFTWTAGGVSYVYDAVRATGC